ncbi:uncharacterized protein LOC141668333 [Apium graveolens]|uniref:uncharacterized protein LOC141668333 n=1 Tax=Apium graveolens TaxID=4045 RepID=UPI003D797741
MSAEAHYIKNPRDPDNLTRWGGALLEISQYANFEQSKRMLGDAVSKFEEALIINPRKHDTLWCLGNAFTNQGFLTPDLSDTEVYFAKAHDCLEKALLESPGNELYIKSLEANNRAPELHRQVQKQGIAGAPANAKMASSASSAERTESDPVAAPVLAPASLQVFPPLPSPPPLPQGPAPDQLPAPEWENLKPQVPVPQPEIPEILRMEPELEPPIYAPQEQPVLFPAPLAIYAPMPGVYQFSQPEFMDEVVVDQPLPLLSRVSRTDLREPRTVTYQRYQLEKEERVRWQDQCTRFLGCLRHKRMVQFEHYDQTTS